jgi:hypothetical protein
MDIPLSLLTVLSIDGSSPAGAACTDGERDAEGLNDNLFQREVPSKSTRKSLTMYLAMRW